MMRNSNVFSYAKMHGYMNKSSRRAFISTRKSVKVDNPYSGEIYCEVAYDTKDIALSKLKAAKKAQEEWKQVSLSQRQSLCAKWMDIMKKNIDTIAQDITGQMGKPLQQAYNEVNGMLARTKALIELSTEALKPDSFAENSGQFRQITHEPIGILYVIAPWNYPLLTAVNSIIPAVLAGNAVLLKHSPRTPLCGQHFQRFFEAAGFPRNLVSACFTDHDTANVLMQQPDITALSFTGSLIGGREVNKNIANRFIETTMELGGNDAAYVASDANIKFAAESITDGVCYNAGQSCCGVERIYVHESKYDEFLDATVPLFNAYKLGDPFQAETTLGPMALPSAPEFLDKHVNQAITQGARRLTGNGIVNDDAGYGRFYSPTLLADCNESMQIMTEESFGPIVGIQKVKNDYEAAQHINNSQYGLTAAVYTTKQEHAMDLGKKLSVGTVFMNRCDALDPYLPWSGLRNSGKGLSLSKHGFRLVTKVKAWNFQVK